MAKRLHGMNMILYLGYPLFFSLRVVTQTINLLSSGIDLESMGIVQRDALLVFRTLCKVGSHFNTSIAVNFL